MWSTARRYSATDEHVRADIERAWKQIALTNDVTGRIAALVKPVECRESVLSVRCQNPDIQRRFRDAASELRTRITTQLPDTSTAQLIGLRCEVLEAPVFVWASASRGPLRGLINFAWRSPVLLALAAGTVFIWASPAHGVLRIVVVAALAAVASRCPELAIPSRHIRVVKYGRVQYLLDLVHRVAR
jgi:hypothetical protein